MQAMAQTFQNTEFLQPEFYPGATTLYELIKAISEELDPTEDELISEIIDDLFESEQVKFLS